MHKIKIILFITIILWGLHAKAQIIPLSVGIKGGVNTSNLNGGLDTDSRGGFNAGLMARLYIPYLYVGANAEITQKGAKIKNFSKPQSGNSETKANPLYLQIPVHLGCEVILGLSARLRLEAGPYWAYGIGGKLKEGGEKVDFFGKDTFKKNDFGLGAGVGFDFWKLGVDVGYDFGLTNISRFETAKVHTRNGYLSFSYRFL